VTTNHRSLAIDAGLVSTGPSVTAFKEQNKMLRINVIGLSNLHSTRFTVKEVCGIVGFSERTFHTRVKQGVIKTHQSTTEFCRDGRPRIYVTADDLAQYLEIDNEKDAREFMGLPAIESEPTPEPENDHRIFADVVAPSTPAPSSSNFDPEPAYGFSTNAAANAAMWHAGEVSDSAGNTGLGTNELHPERGVESLLGPQRPMPRVKPSTTSHMSPGTTGDAGSDRIENPVDSDAFANMLNPGHTDRMAAMYAECGVRPLSEQEQKQRNDAMFLHRAWAR
jgi:hypothetical protein